MLICDDYYEETSFFSSTFSTLLDLLFASPSTSKSIGHMETPGLLANRLTTATDSSDARAAIASFCDLFAQMVRMWHKFADCRTKKFT